MKREEEGHMDFGVNSIVRLRHVPSWFGKVLIIDDDTAVVVSLPWSDIPDVGGWILPIALLEPVLKK